MKEQEDVASKWDLLNLWAKLNELGVNTDELWRWIKDLVIKSIISVEHHMSVNYNRFQRNRGVCFEVYGFDVLIDKKLKPWLLEVNTLPSFSSSSPMDKQIKTQLMSDIFHLIGLSPYDKKKLEKEQETRQWNRLLGLDKGSPNKRTSKNQNLVIDENQNFREIVDKLSQDELTMLVEYEEEMSRRNNFELIFPRPNTVSNYEQYFSVKRQNNLLLWKYVKSGKIKLL